MAFRILNLIAECRRVECRSADFMKSVVMLNTIQPNDTQHEGLIVDTQNNNTQYRVPLYRVYLS